jgi:hypothetical protein
MISQRYCPGRLAGLGRGSGFGPLKGRIEGFAVEALEGLDTHSGVDQNVLGLDGANDINAALREDGVAQQDGQQTMAHHASVLPHNATKMRQPGMAPFLKRGHTRLTHFWGC